MVGDSSQRPRTARGGTALITTSMPLTSAYSQHQNTSDDMNIYVHHETKSINGNLTIYQILNLFYRYFFFLETYNDPLGPLQRPRTSTSRPITSLEKEFANEQVQDLLPE